MTHKKSILDFFQEENINKLFVKEKKRRSVSKSQLVFVGMHNIAQWWWCGMKAVLKSRFNEEDFFYSYLVDRLATGVILGKINLSEKNINRLLDKCAQLDLSDREKVFKENIEIDYDEEMDFLLEDSLNEEYELFQEFDNDSEKLGLLYELNIAEKYPRYRWSFQWNDFVIVGAPDGITKDFVYEFKTTKNEYFFNIAAKQIARTQADLYGMFFKRPYKKVQIYIRESNRIITIEENIDFNRAEETLKKFEAAALGKVSPLAPLPFKCKSCEMIEYCDIYQL